MNSFILRLTVPCFTMILAGCSGFSVGSAQLPSEFFQCEALSGPASHSLKTASTQTSQAGYSLQDKVIELEETVPAFRKASAAGEELSEYVAVYDRQCLEAPGASAAVFSAQLRERSLRYQADPVWVSASELKNLRERLEGDTCLVSFGPNVEMFPLGTAEFTPLVGSSEPLFSQQSHLSFLQAEALWSFVYQNSSVQEEVVVAVIDSGVNVNHEDLTGRLWRKADGKIGHNFMNPAADPIDDDKDAHGTHVAGLIAANGTNGLGGAGVAPKDVAVMPLKVLGAGDNSNSKAHLINAINFAVENKARVINLSLGTFSPVEDVKRAILDAVDKGVFVASAAGNDFAELGKGLSVYPALYAKDIEGFVSVGSVDVSSGAKSAFSNYSSVYVELMAPGATNPSEGLLSTWGLGGNTKAYERLGGTSMATPLVAGAAALIYRSFQERGVVPNADMVERILVKYSPGVSSLSGAAAGGRSLNLARLAEGLGAEFRANGCL